MLIGIDFDNTIAGYDRLFARLAVELGLLEAAPSGGKRAVRDAVRAQNSEGDIAWQRLQAVAYGRRMIEAEMIAGVAEFLAACRRQGVAVCIISHKTRHAAYDPDRVDLRLAAINWMQSKGFFDAAGFGLAPGQVFFEGSRQDKVQRIGELGCTYFIDDLEEVFAEPAFPNGVRAILFDPTGSGTPRRVNCTALSAWDEITEYVLGARH
ncbi:MAG TPA: hypothetical protein VMU42_19960 [Candidatus Sulfotelmatobacter sp.]|nr:hypothetical protein [Candidatus Sulfotelmatobacter sp.]